MGLRLLTLACLAGAAFAGPFQRESLDECSRKCNAGSKKNFNWKVGTTNLYHFKSENNVTYAGVQTENSAIEGVLEHQTVSPCHAVLKLRDIRISQKLTPEEKEDLTKKLEVEISIYKNDGKVEHVCPSPEESTQSLNFKKGIISSFVNHMSNLDTQEETITYDSLGNCKTKYTPIKTNNGVIVKKKVDLESCSRKHMFTTSIFPTTKIPSSLIFPNNSLECTQRIEDGIVKEVECDEVEIMKPPMKDQKSWVELLGKLHIRSIGSKPSEPYMSTENRKKEDLLYDIEEKRKGDSSVKEVEKIVSKLCLKNDKVVDPSVSKDFIELIHAAKSLTYEELSGIYRSMKNGKMYASKKVEDIFVDALPMVGSDGSIKLMVQLINNGHVTGMKENLFPASLALIKDPTNEMIASLLSLTKINDSPLVTLGLSAMIHRLCSREDCTSSKPVNDFVSILRDIIGKGCSSEDDDKTLAALKAFGNMGYHGDAHEDILACMQDSSKPNELRIAAIESFRNMEEKRPDPFMEIYADKNEDPEMRIRSFASVWKKADLEQLRKINKTAKSESDPQVGAYVSSVIENTKKSISPEKTKIKSLLHELNIQTPKFKYWGNSKNIERHYFSKTFKIGGGVESDIIHLNESKIPRFASVCFKADMPKKSVDVLEVAMRVEGLEDIIKKILSFKHSVPNQSSWDLLSSKQLWKDTNTGLAFSVRVFGTEVLGLSQTNLAGFGEMIKIGEMMNKLAQGKSADSSHSFLFMNSKLIVPSVTGRSYSMDFTGTSTVALTGRNKMDFFSYPQNSDLHLQFQPSMNVEISTTVGIHPRKGKSDVRISTNAHMESNFEAKLQLKNGHLVVGSLTFPSENMVKIAFGTNMVNIDAGHNEKPLYNEMQEKFNYCFNKLHKPLGISVCGKLKTPKPMVMESSPYIKPFINGEFAWKKSDSSFKSYEMRLEMPKPSDSKQTYSVLFDTPGSNIPRRIAAELRTEQRPSHKELMINVTTPFITVGVNSSFTKNADGKSYQGKVEVHRDSQQIILVNTTVEVDSSEFKKRCQASVTASYMGSEPVTFESSFIAIKGSRNGTLTKQSIDIKVSRPGSEIIKIKGAIKQEPSQSKYTSSVEVSEIGYIKIGVALDNSKQTTSASLGIDYQKRGDKKHSVSSSVVIQKSSNKTNTDLRFEMTQIPAANWYLNWGRQRDSEGGINNSFDLKYGENPQNNFVSIKQASRIPHPGRGEHTVSLVVPQHDFYYNISTKYNVEKHERGYIPRAHFEFNYQSNRDKNVKGYIGISDQSKGHLNATVKFSIDQHGRRRNYEGKIIKINDNTINAELRLQDEKGDLTKWTGSYKRLSDDSKIHHEAESALQTPSSPSPFKNKVSLKINDEAVNFAGNIGPKYSIKAYSSQVVTHANLELDSLKADLKVNNEVSRKNINIDVRILGERSKRVIGSLAVEKSEKKSEFNSTLRLYIDNEMKSKALLYTGVEILEPGKSHRSLSKLHIQDVIDISLSEKRDVSSSLINFKCDGNGWNPITAEIKTIRDMETANVSMNLEIQNQEVAKVQVDAVWKHSAKKHVVSVNGSVNSPYPPINNIVMYFTQEKTLHRKSTAIQSLLYFKRDETSFKAELDSNFKPDGLDLKTAVEASNKNSKKHSLGIVVQLDPEEISSSMGIETHNEKEVSIAFKIKKHEKGLIFEATGYTPITEMRDMKIVGAVDYRGSKKSFKFHADVHNERVVHITASLKLSSQKTEAEAMVNIANLPFFEDKRFRVEIQRTKSSFKVSGNVQEISFFSEIKKDGNVESLEATLNAPHKNLKVFIEDQSSRKKLKLSSEVEGKREVDAEISFKSSSRGSEIEGHLQTLRNPKKSVHIKYEITKELLAFSTNLFKGKSSLFSITFNSFSHSRGLKISMETKKFDKNIIAIEISKDKLRNNSEKISFKVNGEFPAVSVTISKNYNDPISKITEVGLCKEGQKTVCYSLKSAYKNVLTSDIDGFDQRLIIDFKKSVRGSHAEALGRLEVVVYQDKTDFESKIVFQSNNNKTIGFKTTRHNLKDRHSFHIDVFLPQRAPRLSLVYQHKPQQLKMEMEFIPDMENPTSKFAIDMMVDVNHESKKISAYIRSELPERDEPLLFTCKWQLVDDKFDKVNMLLHYSTTKGKTLNFEIDPKPQGTAYKLYSEDKKIDAHFKIIKYTNSDECEFGVEWKFTSGDKNKEGGLIAALYHKKSETYKRMSIKCYGPSHDFELQGRISKALGNASLSFVSSGRKIKEITMETSNSCLRVKVHHSDPPVNGSICFNKQDGHTWKMVTADIYCHQQKCFDLSLSKDPSLPEFFSVNIKWAKKELQTSLIKASGYDDIFGGRSLKSILRELKDKLDWRKIEREIQDKLRRVKERIEEEISRKSRLYSDELEEHFQATTHVARSFIKFIVDLIPVEYFVQQVFKPLRETTRCFFHEYSKMIWEHVPQFVRLVMDATRNQFERCLKKFCVEGTFCHDFFQDYKNYGALPVKNFVKNLFSQIISYLKSVFSFSAADVLNYIHSLIVKGKKEVEATFGKFMGDMILSKIAVFCKQIEKKIREKVVFLLDNLKKKCDDWIDQGEKKIEKFFDNFINNINNIFSGDEDYRIAKSLASDAKRKIADVWRNKAEISNRSLQAVKDDIKENAKNLIREQIQVEKFDLKEGVVKFSFRQPLGATEVQILKNEFRAINRKLDEYLNN